MHMTGKPEVHADRHDTSMAGAKAAFLALHARLPRGTTAEDEKCFTFRRQYLVGTKESQLLPAFGRISSRVSSKAPSRFAHKAIRLAPALEKA